MNKKDIIHYIILFILCLIVGSLIGCTKEATVDESRHLFRPPDGGTPSAWNKGQPCYNMAIDVEGPIDTYTYGLWNMAVNGNIGDLQGEIGGSSGGRIPGGLGDDPEGDGYAQRLTVGGHIIAMYHPETYVDHFIVFRESDSIYWRYDLGHNERRCDPIVFRTNSN